MKKILTTLLTIIFVSLNVFAQGSYNEKTVIELPWEDFLVRTTTKKTLIYTTYRTETKIRSQVLKLKNDHITRVIDHPYMGRFWTKGHVTNKKSDELIVQDGDNRFGGNGYLELVNPKNLEIIDTIVLPGRKTFYYAQCHDLDGDGRDEIIFCPNSFNSGGLAVARWQHNHLELAWFYETPFNLREFAIGDFNHNGLPEIVIAEITQQGELILRDFEIIEKDSFEFQEISHYSLGFQASLASVITFDSSHIVVGYSGPYIGYHYLIIEPVGPDMLAKWQFSYTTDPTKAFGETAALAGDFDGDGQPELVCSFPPYAILFKQNENGIWQEQQKLTTDNTVLEFQQDHRPGALPNIFVLTYKNPETAILRIFSYVPR